MIVDRLTRDLHQEIQRIPLIDPHSHIDPRRPTARSLDDILGYHYYTELAHSAGMSQTPLDPATAPRDRVRTILEHMDRFDNTVQYRWFVDIAQTFLGFRGQQVTAQDCDWLCDAAEATMAAADWESQVWKKTNLEQIFLTNDFDDPLTGFDTSLYVPCLRTDDLVFHLDKPQVRERLARTTGLEVHDAVTLRRALSALFERFVAKNAKACAISLPPSFAPRSVAEGDLSQALGAILRGREDVLAKETLASGVFWMLADHCHAFNLPFDLMIGVNRRVYRDGVFQGQDLFDQRTSLLQYGELFNAFPQVAFCISVLTSAQNQELASYSWIFPNVITSGHWWYSNIPAYIEHDTRCRLQAVPRTKQLGYYSDAYKLEFVLPKFDMYRRILAKILADDFVRPGIYSERQALALARNLLHDNPKRIFQV